MNKTPAEPAAQQKKRLAELLEQLQQVGPFMRGSVVNIGRKQLYYSLSCDGKTKLVYLGKKREALAMQYCDNYKRLVKIIDEITHLRIAMLKAYILEAEIVTTTNPHDQLKY